MPQVCASGGLKRESIRADRPTLPGGLPKSRQSAARASARAAPFHSRMVYCLAPNGEPR